MTTLPDRAKAALAAIERVERHLPYPDPAYPIRADLAIIREALELAAQPARLISGPDGVSTCTKCGLRLGVFVCGGGGGGKQDPNAPSTISGTNGKQDTRAIFGGVAYASPRDYVQPTGDLVRREDVLRAVRALPVEFGIRHVREAMEALPAATPERGQGEPVAWIDPKELQRLRDDKWACVQITAYECEGENAPLYAAPPAPAAAESEAMELLEVAKHELIWCSERRHELRVNELVERIRTYLEKHAAAESKPKPPEPSAP